MKQYATVLLFCLLTLSGCRKLIDIDERYIGSWGGNDGAFRYNLSITEDGGAKYDRNSIMGGYYGQETWFGPLKSNGRRFQIAYSSPWFIILENPVLSHDDISDLFHDTIYRDNNWRIRFKYPKTIGYDGREVTMYRVKR